MTDSIRVLSPTDRITDADGVPVPGAKLRFFQAGTSTPQTVYADKGLSVALGVTVYCDSGGYPVTTSGGTTKTPIWIGALNYKVEITDSDDNDVFPPLDNLDGALDTSGFGGTGETAPTVVAKSFDFTAGTTSNVLYDCDATSAAIAATLPSAAAVGDDFVVFIRKKDSSANAVTPTRAGSDTIRWGAISGATTVTLASQGDTIALRSDGAGWVAESYCILGSIVVALQADMEAASSILLPVTPGRQHFHPGHPKFWAFVTVASGTPTLVSSYNVTSITDTATGRLTITIANDFSSANYCAHVSTESPSVGVGSELVASVSGGTRAVSSVEVCCINFSGSAADPSAWHVLGLGDL